MNKIKLIKETVVDQIEISELDLKLLDELFGPNPDGHDYDWIFDENHDINWDEGDHCPIDLLEKSIAELKAKGVTHIQICQHGDHHGYYLTGSKLKAVYGDEAIELQKKKLLKEIKLAEAQYKQNENYLELQSDEIAKMYKELNKLEGYQDPIEDADNIS